MKQRKIAIEQPEKQTAATRCSRFRLPLIFLLFIGTWLWTWIEAQAQAILIRSFFFNPTVIRSDRTEPVEFKVKISGSPSSVQLRLEAGGTVSLSSGADDIWSTSLTASQVLFGYGADDVNRNFVGFLDVFDGGTPVMSLNTFINVLDGNIPAVNVVNLRGQIRCSKHVANIWTPDLLPNPSLITQAFYQAFDDDYDFINLVSALPSSRANRHHLATKNEVEGIGVIKFNDTAKYGNAGSLQGINAFPIDTFFDMAETGALHELGHQWINFLDLPILAAGTPHWPISSLARGIMGWSNLEGLMFPFNLIPLGNGDYQLQPAMLLREFTDLDLYLMGLLPASAVGSHIVFENQNQTVCNGCILQGPVVTVNASDIIAAHGPRIPDASTSPKEFRMATIIVTRERLLNDDEMALFDYFAARGEATSPLPFSFGLAKGTTKPFFVATQGLGRLITSLGVFPCSTPGHVTQTQSGDTNEVDDAFGQSLTTGDFNGDGKSDLAIGVPGEEVSGADSAGMVIVYYGEYAREPQHWGQLQAGETAETGDRFGAAIAAGDFNGDGWDDLVIGVPGEEVTGAAKAGMVVIYYGSSAGLQASGAQLWHQSQAGAVNETGDQFGASLAAGDFNNDGTDDLVIGTPGQDFTGAANAGMVVVYYGSATGLRASGAQLWQQSQAGESDEADDQFGASLAPGDFNGDSHDDLAIGVPGENIDGATDAGLTVVYYGSATGLQASGAQLWDQSQAGTSNDAGDLFGAALASGNFDGDPHDDLAIGVPGEDISGATDAGQAVVYYGSPSGLQSSGAQPWNQSQAGAGNDAGDQFGVALASGNFNGDLHDDLAISVPGESFNGTMNTGMVVVYYGASGGLASIGAERLDQKKAFGIDESGDQLGLSLASGDFDSDSKHDLAIGAPNEDIGALVNAGEVYVYAGSPGGFMTSVADRGRTRLSIPEAYALAQNYPNPFNPSTTIEFDVRKTGRVTLKIYNTLGQEVAILVDENLPAGRHAVAFDATGLPSGLYFYRLSVNSFSQVKKMELIK